VQDEDHGDVGGYVMIEPAVVKRKSEAAIIAASGKICDWLPTIDTENLTVRDARAVAERALVLNALVNLSFGAPKDFIAGWLLSNGLRAALSPKEQAILTKPGQCPSLSAICSDGT
jgi:hypothetical protein